MKLLQTIMSLAGLSSLQDSPNMAEMSIRKLSLEHLASIQFTSWLSAFNTGDKETIMAYHTDLNFPVSVLEGDIGMIDREMRLAQVTGGFDVALVESSDDPSFVVVVLTERKERGNRRHLHARANMSVDTSQPTYPATKFNINPCVTPLDLIPTDDPRRPEYENALAPLTDARRRAIVDGISDVLREQYVNPALGEDIAAALNAKVGNGDYDAINDNEEFANRVSDDMREAGQNKHMFVRFFEPPLPRNETDGDDEPHKAFHFFQSVNFGFENTSFDDTSVSGRVIATLPINMFLPIDADHLSDVEEIRSAIGEKISSVADADALLVDLRHNTGGDPNTIAFILSYLLDNGPLDLMDFVDRNGTMNQSFSTTAVNELPAGSKRFGGSKPLFVLTSNWTISGGEDMAYGLQGFKRAMYIIGEGNDATFGAANPINEQRYVAKEIFGKGWWFVAVPGLKPVHAVTGSNWEGIGVKSDVIAGQGEWEDEKDAAEVGRKLAIRILQRDEVIEEL